MSVVPMEAPDLPDVMAVERGCFEAPWSARAFMDELRRDVSQVLLARGDTGLLLGFICFWVLFDEAHILNIAVRASHRRMGVGRLLARRALGAAARLGAVRATLEVRSANTAAIGLYGSMGFERAGLRKGYYDHPKDDAVIMWLYDMGGLAGACGPMDDFLDLPNRLS